jgi:hypothetical protein
MTQTPRRLGPEIATHAVGFQVSAGMLGAALAPGVAGLAVERGGLESIPRFILVSAVLLVAVHEATIAVAAARGNRSNDR